MIKKNNNILRRGALRSQAVKEALNVNNAELKVVYPQSFVEKIKKISHKKIYDFSFVGSLAFFDGKSHQEHRPKIHRKGFNNRKWIIPFAKKHFGGNSIFINTSKDLNQEKKWSTLGVFDKTLSQGGIMPHDMEDRAMFDEDYYTIMCQSKFTLCPAGDAMWSMRFFEAMMCKSIPIIKRPAEAWRLEEEKRAGYIYYLADELKSYSREVVNHNYNLFIKHHTFLQQ